MSVCGRCSAAVSADELRCPVCAFVVPSSSSSSSPGFQVFRCQGCGAAQAWSPEKAALACAFCDGRVTLDAVADPIEQATSWAPFSVTAAQAAQALSSWQRSLSWFRPADLASSSTVHELRPLCWPAWIVEGQADVRYAADVKAPAGHRAAFVPRAGASHVEFDGVVVGASRGLSVREMERLAAAPVTATTLSPPPVAGRIDEAFDVERSVGRARVIAAVEEHARAQVAASLPRSRKLAVTLVLEGLTTTRVALPAWIIAWRYNGIAYRCVVDGRDASVVIGDAPWSKQRIVGAIVGGIAVAAAIAWALAR
jgi:hypothetical protein